MPRMMMRMPVRLSAAVATFLYAWALMSGTASAQPAVGGTSGFGVIQGNALGSSDAAMTGATVRLRDARRGRVVQSTMTDKSGVFTFNDVEPGSYVVELVGVDGRVLTASAILNVNAAEMVSAIVKLPFRIPPLSGVLGHTAPSAMVVTAAAAASGVLALQVAGNDVTPRK